MFQNIFCIKTSGGVTQIKSKFCKNSSAKKSQERKNITHICKPRFEIYAPSDGNLRISSKEVRPFKKICALPLVTPKIVALFTGCFWKIKNSNFTRFFEVNMKCCCFETSSSPTFFAFGIFHALYEAVKCPLETWKNENTGCSLFFSNSFQVAIQICV